ncbi:MAG TPA: hypothetical protein VFW82_04620 [Dyella sp.]|nr:hypothetical protein [Dyella sp.]
MPRLSVAAALTLLTLTACSRTMDDSDIKQNPHPKQAYEITVRLENVPGTVKAVTGSTLMEVADTDCVPQDPVSGARPYPHPAPAFELRQIQPNVYKGVAYLDPLADEDYSGLGVCHWRLNMLNVRAEIGKAEYVAGLTLDQVKAGSEGGSFFRDLFYKGDPEHWIAMSWPTDHLQDVQKHPDQFFAIKVAAKELGK